MAIMNGGPDPTGTTLVDTKVSHHSDEQNSPNTFKKIVTDYGSGITVSDTGKVIDKEILVGLNKQTTDKHPQNDPDVGIYELYLDAQEVQEYQINIEDWDGDGLSNYIEVENGLDPLVKNTDYFPSASSANSTVPENINTLKAYPQGTYGNGKLFGGLRTANNNKGYFYQNAPGNGENNTDNYGIPDTLNRIERVARVWEKRHPDLAPLKANIFTTGQRDNLYTSDSDIMNGIRIGTNDLSFQNGGDTPDHNSHENGLDIDVWYMRKDNAEYTNSQTFAGVPVGNILYSEDLSAELVKLFVEIGGAVRVFVNINSGITGTNIVQRQDHIDHMHVAFPNPNPPTGTGTITLTAAPPQQVGEYYVSTVRSEPITDRYGKPLFNGFLVHVSTSIGSWETDFLCIKYNTNGTEIDRGVCVNDGRITFRIKKSTQGGTAEVRVDTNSENYNQGYATSTTTINFNQPEN